MKKNIFLILVLVGLVSCICSDTFAADSLTVSTSVPFPSGVTPNIISVVPNITVNCTTGVATDIGWKSFTILTPGPQPLNFGLLKMFTQNDLSQFGCTPAQIALLPTFSVFVSDHYYSMDMAFIYGATQMNQMTFGWSESGNPSLFGNKVTAAFVVKQFDPNANGGKGGDKQPEAAPFSTQLLSTLQSSPYAVTFSQLSGGWLRVYLGLITNKAAAGMPAGADQIVTPGAYTGTFTITTS